MGAADLPRYPLAVKFLYVAILPANACHHTKFQLSGLRASGIGVEVLKLRGSGTGVKG